MPFPSILCPIGMKLLVWDGVEDQLRRRLALWKRDYIFKGGRFTLIKSFMVSMPIYRLFLVRMPKAVAICWKNCKMNFLWGGTALGRSLI